MDATHVITGSADKVARLFSRATGEVVLNLVGHLGAVTAVALDATQMLTGSWDSTIWIWDRCSGEVVHQLVGHNRMVTSCVMDATHVLTGSRDKTTRCGEMLKTMVQSRHSAALSS